MYYINHIAEQLSSTTHLFADDTMMYMAVRSERDAELFQSDLDKLTEWEDRWMVQFHPEKCEAISIYLARRTILSQNLHNAQSSVETCQLH